MELTLTAKEINAALLEYAQREFPGAFDEVHVSANYGSVLHATFTKSDPPAPISAFAVPRASDDAIRAFDA